MIFLFNSKRVVFKAFMFFLILILICLLYLMVGKKIHSQKTIHNRAITQVFTGEVKKSLAWEEDMKFLEVLRDLNIKNRVTAFQTTLPDPLPGEEYNVALAADLLAGTVVKPGEFFSMNDKIGPYTATRGFKEGPTYNGTQVSQTVGGGVCKIASTLYNTVILAGMEVIERHSHGMLVPYVPPGQDATVAYGKRDFKFKNNTSSSILIWSDTEKNTLFIAFYGKIMAPKVRWQHQVLNRQKTYSLVRYNEDLAPNMARVVIPGEDGMTVKSSVILNYSEGKIEERDLGISYYKPMPRVIERGIKQDTWE